MWLLSVSEFAGPAMRPPLSLSGLVCSPLFIHKMIVDLHSVIRNKPGAACTLYPASPVVTSRRTTVQYHSHKTAGVNMQSVAFRHHKDYLCSHFISTPTSLKIPPPSSSLAAINFFLHFGKFVISRILCKRIV